MQFPIWHWAIVLPLIGVPVFFAVRSATKPSQNPDDLVGFGGWLMLLAIGQCLAPFPTLADLYSSSEGYQQLMPLPNGPLAVCGEVMLSLAFTLLQLIVLGGALVSNSYSRTSGSRSHLRSRSLFGPPRF
ncbi:hypothetical protein RFN28_09660 [Mesorhizobium sp. VK24D]|uniref:Uncharacterized protein n=1 Tax=Mesorhizobium album TaxID=3072314 RepID=A0ABU4XVM0_9HYPH|nr:hypothetical protein [Mesorhizobium sp. VK24D]MDX8478744.1 hypothetical protein [Mesorhizobium sp. VK24D]